MVYIPDKAIHPGRIVSTSLRREGMTQKNLCNRTGLSEKHLSQIINGEASITVETALLLENALGGSASFWINLEKNYQETKARIERGVLLKKEADLLYEYPYLELSKRGYVPETAKREERVANLWRFFGVNSLQYIPKTQPAAFRKRKAESKNQGKIAAWLRCGEIDANKNEIKTFSEQKLKGSLNELMKLSTLPAEKFSEKAINILSGAGVHLVYIPHFKNSGVSGAVRWIGKNPIIQLSLLGAYADMFWFNLFHEVGHLLIHGKKEKFVEFSRPLLNKKEAEANDFAANTLIPKKKYEKFLKSDSISRNAIADFAKELEINPGIIEGRLMHDGFIDWKSAFGFRHKLKFA